MSESKSYYRGVSHMVKKIVYALLVFFDFSVLLSCALIVIGALPTWTIVFAVLYILIQKAVCKFY